MITHLWLIRFISYYRRRGLINTVCRVFQKLKELLFRKPDVLFYVDLEKIANTCHIIPKSFNLECFASEGEIGKQDLNALLAHNDEKIFRYYLEERFGCGALIWLAKIDNNLAGYVWSVSGRTVRPHYFPITSNDIHLFDDLIFDEFRGRGINTLLINSVLDKVKKEGLIRAFIETRITNTSEIRSLAKTSFQEFALARIYYIHRHSFVIWSYVS